jgi:hypothetical protein
VPSAVRQATQARGSAWWVVSTAIDRVGQVIDVFISPRRNAAARRFFWHAITGDIDACRHRPHSVLAYLTRPRLLRVGGPTLTSYNPR